MATFLITGGCGFIGTHLTRFLLQQGHHVRVIDNLSDQQTHSLPAEVDFIQGDCQSQALLEEYLQGVSAVFHLAASPYPKEDGALWLEAQQMNLGTTVAILEALRKQANQHIALVYTSSAEVYGDNASHPLQENARPCPQSAYSTDKLCSELQIRTASRQFGLPSIILRLFNVYGPSYNQLRRNEDVIASFVRSLQSGKALVIHGSGEQTRDFLYMDDAVRMLYAALEHASPQAPIINACSGISHSINQVVDQLLRVSDSITQMTRQPASSTQIRQSVGDPRKARHLLKVAAHIELQEGLRQMLAHSVCATESTYAKRWG